MLCDCQGAVRAADPRPDADREAVEALRLGLDRWERSVEFRCAFRYRVTFVPRLEDAKQGTFNDAPVSNHAEPKDGGLNATGILCKKGNLVRLRLDYGQPPKPVERASRREIAWHKRLDRRLIR